MKKKLLFSALVGAMLLTLLAACGPATGGDTSTPTPIPTQGGTVTPTEGLTDQPAKDVTADAVCAAVAAASGGSEMEDFAFAVEEFYEGCEEKAEDFSLYMPGASSLLEEIFVAKASGGDMDALKTICQTRQADLEAQAKEYPATGTYVKDAKLVTEGDWLIFCVCKDPDAAVAAFRSSLK